MWDGDRDVRCGRGDELGCAERARPRTVEEVAEGCDRARGAEASSPSLASWITASPAPSVVAAWMPLASLTVNETPLKGDLVSPQATRASFVGGMSHLPTSPRADRGFSPSPWIVTMKRQ
jgi:hypothetical protein